MLYHQFKLNKMEEEVVTPEQTVIQPNEKIRNKILQFEKAIKTIDSEKYHVYTDKNSEKVCPLTHSFSSGIYVREIFIPAGMFVVGKIHKHDHPNFLLKGDVVVVTEDGVEELSAPMSMISKAGTKRALYAKTDLVWTTIHLNPTDTQNIEELEEDIIASSYEEYEAFKKLEDKNTNTLKLKI
jgi:hypothetical protein